MRSMDSELETECIVFKTQRNFCPCIKERNFSGGRVLRGMHSELEWEERIWQRKRLN